MFYYEHRITYFSQKSKCVFYLGLSDIYYIAHVLPTLQTVLGLLELKCNFLLEVKA